MNVAFARVSWPGAGWLDYSVDDMRRKDWSQVRAIYGEGLASGLAAFMLSPPRWQTWDRGHLDIGRTVARTADDRILGWSALAPVPDN